MSSPASVLSPGVLEDLNRGRRVPATVEEWMAVDVNVLVPALLPELGLADRAEMILPRVAEAAREGIGKRPRMIGAAFHDACRDNPNRSAIFESVASHRLDMVRIWAAQMLAADPSPTFADRMAVSHRFAADNHLAVREAGWETFRPYIEADLAANLALLSEWVRDPDPNIRRCAVEGTRPRGVWAKSITALKSDPTPGLVILEPVRADASHYVRNAAGNWLNDASKSRPDWVCALADRWSIESPCPESAYIIKRGLRTLRKKG